MEPEIAAMFPTLADAPHLRPFDPDRFAAWAVATGKPETASGLLALAGFVLAFIPPNARSPLVAAVAWPSPTDEKHAARALVVLHERDRTVLVTWLRASWMSETYANVEQAIRCSLASPARVANLLRLDAANGNDATGITARCPKSGGTRWASSHEAPDGRGTIPARQEQAPTHRCTLTMVDNTLRFQCPTCGLDGDVLRLVAVARGIDPKNRAAVLREAAGLSVRA
jgi:hypothetical protein